MRHHRVDNHIIHLYRRELFRNSEAGIDEHSIANTQHVCLVHDRHMFFTCQRKLKSRARDPLAALTRDAAQRHDHIRCN